MQGSPSQVLSTDHLTQGSIDQGRSPQEDGASLVHYDRLLRHGGYIGPPCCTVATHYGHLWHTQAGQYGFIVECPASMFLAREYFCLGTGVTLFSHKQKYQYDMYKIALLLI